MEFFYTCNDCPQLNITENEQLLLRLKGEEKFHLCYKYGKRVCHWSNKKGNHDPRIYPCAECRADRIVPIPVEEFRKLGYTEEEAKKLSELSVIYE